VAFLLISEDFLQLFAAFLQFCWKSDLNKGFALITDRPGIVIFFDSHSKDFTKDFKNLSEYLLIFT